ncbi:hypothetical protein PPTG_18103 [Phytophthora nicotianae INRA-310]|uniref:PiggyBac transposable element-derived protein 4 C-terminal zinc-ribbon domain-containing protein n=1 Tax=Phytophthora nicotianae (strain INRA-310) TaxID=761204 RepID=W2PK57_PHYN3|nr:hypothetical protein PPTG_18103 [Phytophthora nicotianae INRA-310]ETN00420.1 hypothetical protein PPTG_18103 [Phytophthora nicotianae INRA-310]
MGGVDRHDQLRLQRYSIQLTVAFKKLRNNEGKYKGKKRKKTRDGSTASNLQRKGKKRKGKRRQHLCKVCSALATPQTKSFETSYYCEQCTSNFGGYVPLCNKVRHKETGNTLTCGQISHELWRNGTAIPAHLKNRIRFRKRKHFEVSSDSDDGGSDANED